MRLNGALKNVEKELTKEIPVEVTPTCFINLEYEDGTKDGFYYLEEPLSLSGSKFISSNSPFGSVLAGKKVGDNFVFDSAGIFRSGKIVSIT
jgi:transcription elongation GreA/GreB family factor